MSRSPSRDEVQRAMSHAHQLWAPADPAAEGATAGEIHATRESLRSALKRMELIKTNCADCRHFQADECSLHGPVPREFVRTEHDCPDWRWDDVPF